MTLTCAFWQFSRNTDTPNAQLVDGDDCHESLTMIDRREFW